LRAFVLFRLDSMMLIKFSEERKLCCPSLCVFVWDTVASFTEVTLRSTEHIFGSSEIMFSPLKPYCGLL
jgi:hypothetical protein